MEERPMNFQELKEIALANPKGKIVASDAMPPDEDNIGAWDETDCYRDVFTDIRQAIKRLPSSPKTLLGSHETLRVMMQPDPYADERNRSRMIDGCPQLLIWESIIPLFYQSLNMFPDKGFIQFDDSADPGIVLLVGSDERDVVLIDTR